MSYILDALRKSEQQRQHGMAPTLASASYPNQQGITRGKPAWPLMALLVVFLLAAGAAIGWLRPWQTALPSPPAPQLPIAPAPVATIPAPVPAASEIAPPVSLPPPEPLTASSKPSPVAAASDPAPALQPPTTAQKEDSGPPPKITMTVHAYSSDPADRLAGINGKMVREGEQVEPGLKLERITADGVILNYRGRRLRHDMR